MTPKSPVKRVYSVDDARALLSETLQRIAVEPTLVQPMPPSREGAAQLGGRAIALGCAARLAAYLEACGVDPGVSTIALLRNSVAAKAAVLRWDAANLPEPLTEYRVNPSYFFDATIVRSVGLLCDVPIALTPIAPAGPVPSPVALVQYFLAGARGDSSGAAAMAAVYETRASHARCLVSGDIAMRPRVLGRALVALEAGDAPAFLKALRAIVRWHDAHAGPVAATSDQPAVRSHLTMLHCFVGVALVIEARARGMSCEERGPYLPPELIDRC